MFKGVRLAHPIERNTVFLNVFIILPSVLLPTQPDVPHAVFGIHPEAAAKRSPEEELFDAADDPERDDAPPEDEADVDQALLDHNC